VCGAECVRKKEIEGKRCDEEAGRASEAAAYVTSRTLHNGASNEGRCETV